jgi:hypothetical protein
MTSPYRPLPPGVRRFRLDPATYRSLVSRSFVRGSILGAALAALALAGATWVNDSIVEGFAIVAGVAMGIIALVVVGRLLTLERALAPALQHYELLVSDRVVRRSNATDPVAEVLRPEVTGIVETPGGLWLSCAKPHRSLLVARALDGYADVREAVSAWGPIRSFGGWQAYRYARAQRGHQGPRDALLGTALAADASLVAELESVRAASAPVHGPAPVGLTPKRPGRTIALWAALVIAFLAIWQVLQPVERRPITSDRDCQRACSVAGLCRAQGGRCVATSDDDCRRSEACNRAGRCQAVNGSCRPAGERTPAPASSRPAELER